MKSEERSVYLLLFLWFTSKLMVLQPEISFKTANSMCSVSLRVPPRGPGGGDRGQHGYWGTTGISLCPVWSPDRDYSEKRQSFTTGGFVLLLQHWYSPVIYYTLFYTSFLLYIYCFWCLMTGSREVSESGRSESSLYSSGHVPWVRPREGGRFCSGEARRTGLPGS